MVHRGQIDVESFRTNVPPSLQPGDIVVMDNLGSHKSKIVRQLIRYVGAKLFFLPKYSPDLNPIEQVFAKLKYLPRKAAARTIDSVCASSAASPTMTIVATMADPITSSGHQWSSVKNPNSVRNELKSEDELAEELVQQKLRSAKEAT